MSLLRAWFAGLPAYLWSGWGAIASLFLLLAAWEAVSLVYGPLVMPESFGHSGGRTLGCKDVSLHLAQGDDVQIQVVGVGPAVHVHAAARADVHVKLLRHPRRVEVNGQRVLPVTRGVVDPAVAGVVAVAAAHRAHLSG